MAYLPRPSEPKEQAEHWSGNGHADDEIRIHHSNVYLRIMGSMQLAAIGLRGWINGAFCCCCIPLDIGGLLISVFLFLRGLLALLEVIGFNYIIFSGENNYWTNPFLWVAYVMMVIGGVGDVVAAMCGSFGVMHQQAIPTLVLGCWLLVHTVFGVLFLTIVSTLDTLDIGSCMTLILGFFVLILPDIFCFTHSLQALLDVTWKSTVNESMVAVLNKAERLAVRFGSTTIDKNHIVMALLTDTESRQLLQYGGVDVARIENDLKSGGSFLAGEKYGEERMFEFYDPLPLGADATPLIAEAAREQWGAFQSRLNADHLILALTSGGMIVLTPKGKDVQTVGGRVVSRDATPTMYPVPNAWGMREFIERDLREACNDPGPPPALVFGCLPVEECVMVYIGLQVVVCLTSVITVVFFGRSVAVWVGMRTVNELRTVELLSSLIGLLTGGLALFGISGHRAARIDIRVAAHKAGARWAAELDEAWGRVRSFPDAPTWLNDLQRGATFLSLNFGWNAVQLFIDLPIIFGILTFGNACGGYSFGVTRVSELHLQGQTRMHCTSEDVSLITFLIAWMVLKLYMCWCMLALWHEYAYGWTTTELRGRAYLDPIAPLPESLTRQLAGLPKVPQKRLADEKTPLVL